ncbi:hypothetical protein LTR98_011814, partial [Exophiala xenobiotica]
LGRSSIIVASWAGSNPSPEKAFSEAVGDQLEGIRSMWREVVENQKQGGVILALRPWVPGRLCKVISLLATISECSRSPDQNIRDQIPPHLRQSKALILTPASLGDNWRQEFVKWARNCTSLGDFYHIASSDTEPIEQWHRRGGILLLSYDRFTNYLSSPTRHEADTDVPTDYDDDMGKILLEGPNIVIADEAHQMKNSNSKLGRSDSHATEQ